MQKKPRVNTITDIPPGLLSLRVHDRGRGFSLGPDRPDDCPRNPRKLSNMQLASWGNCLYLIKKRGIWQ